METCADLEQGAVQFRKGASGVRRQMWWKNMKWRLIVGGGILIILAIIIGEWSHVLCDNDSLIVD